LSCSLRKGLEYCFLCDEFPCKKYDGADQTDSFITHKNQFRDIEKAKQMGIAAYEDELNLKIKMLEELLENYDDGRRKGLFCIAVNLLELKDVSFVMKQIKEETTSLAELKEKAKVAARLFEARAAELGIELRLRKKAKG